MPARRLPLSTRNLVLAFRPDSIVVDRAGGDLAATLKVAAPAGPQTHLVMEAADTDVLAIVKADFASSDGETLSLSFPADSLHIFDEAAGKAI